MSGPSPRVGGGGQPRTASIKRLPSLPGRRAVEAHSFTQPQPSGGNSVKPNARQEVMEAALHANGNATDRPVPPGSQGHFPNLPHDLTSDITRRSAVIAACGAATIWWLGIFPLSATDHRAIERVVANVPFEEARATCTESAGICATLYSQMSSTLRQLTTGYITDDLFQASCERRLGSPYIQECMIALEESLPVIGVELAYAPDLRGTGWILAASGRPRLDPEAREKFEGLTLRGLQRCRRIQRLSVAMSERRYTPAAVQLLTQDLRELNNLLETMLAEISSRSAAARG